MSEGSGLLLKKIPAPPLKSNPAPFSIAARTSQCVPLGSANNLELRMVCGVLPYEYFCQLSFQHGCV